VRLAELADEVRAGRRAAVARAITLVESRRADHREQAQELLAALLPHSGGAQRVGISGVPAGASAFELVLGFSPAEPRDALGLGLRAGERRFSLRTAQQCFQ